MGYETDVVHPAVAQWLTDRGYTYRHEVKIPYAGRADFIATHPNGDTLIVECKIDARAYIRTVTQVTGYCAAYGKPSSPAIAMPDQYITEDVREISRIRGIALIGVPVEGYDNSLDGCDPINEGMLHNILTADHWYIDTGRYVSLGLVHAISIYLQHGLSLGTIQTIFDEQRESYTPPPKDFTYRNIAYVGDPLHEYARFVYVAMECGADMNWIKSRTIRELHYVAFDVILQLWGIDFPSDYCIVLWGKSEDDLLMELNIPDKKAQFIDHATDSHLAAEVAFFEHLAGYLSYKENPTTGDLYFILPTVLEIAKSRLNSRNG